MHKWILGLAIVLQLCSGCGKRSSSYRPSRQELRLNLKSEPPTLDPRKASDSASIALLGLCFDGLTRMDQEDNPSLAIAESVSISEDQTRYLFTLKKTYWSDGEPLTANDFEKTWKQILDPSFPSECAQEFFIFKGAKAAKMGKCSLQEVGIKALDPYTLQVDLEHPVPYFLSALASHSFVPTPTHIIENNPSWLETAYVGNGPFYLKKKEPQSLILLEKNPHYWDADKVKLQTVSFACIQDEQTELTMFENRELDWAGYPLSSLPTEALPFLVKTQDVEIYDIAGTYCYVFNTTEYPFTNAHIRKALSLAIHRADIVQHVTLMNQKVATTLVPPMLWKHSSATLQSTKPRVLKASDLSSSSSKKMDDFSLAQKEFQKGLQELGITKEQFPVVNLSYNTMSGHHKIAQAIQEQWKNLFGIQVHLENKEWKVFLDELQLGQFQVARLGGIASFEDPTTFLDDFRYLSTGKNCSKWHNPRYTELLEEVDFTVDPVKRERLLKLAEEILLNEMPVAPIYFYTGIYIKQPYVKGIHISKLNHLDLKWAYIDIEGVEENQVLSNPVAAFVPAEKKLPFFEDIPKMTEESDLGLSQTPGDERSHLACMTSGNDPIDSSAGAFASVLNRFLSHFRYKHPPLNTQIATADE